MPSQQRLTPPPPTTPSLPRRSSSPSFKCSVGRRCFCCTGICCGDTEAETVLDKCTPALACRADHATSSAWYAGEPTVGSRNIFSVSLMFSLLTGNGERRFCSVWICEFFSTYDRFLLPGVIGELHLCRVVGDPADFDLQELPYSALTGNYVTFFDRMRPRQWSPTTYSLLDWPTMA